MIEDIGLARERNGDWIVSDYYVRRGEPAAGLLGLRRARGERLLVAWDAIVHTALHEPQAASTYVAAHDEMKPADFADALHEMNDKRRVEVATELQDERLADVLQEMPDDDQVQIISALDMERAADVLEEMDPDDAADLLCRALRGHQARAAASSWSPRTPATCAACWSTRRAPPGR